MHFTWRPMRACLVLLVTCIGAGSINAQTPEEANPASDAKQTPAAQPEAPAAAAPAKPEKPGSPISLRESLCLEVGWAALETKLPVSFLFRLIWQESRFTPDAVSHAGAQGIAQFMPGTARWRGLEDPFEPVQSIHKSAQWLAELRDQFGNLGLAAAAYNAGPRRVQEWLAGRGNLPAETRAYVQIITGHAAEEWVRSEPADAFAGNTIPCDLITKPLAQRASPPAIRDSGAWGPWGLQLAGSWSESRVLADYQALQRKYPQILGDRSPLIVRGRMAGRGSATWYNLRVAETTRENASKLCSQLEKAGGLCNVVRN